jgi:glycosyltransferase involved in cell wall biosynthesis
MTTPQELSIVIPAKNEARFLPQLLRSLVVQSGVNMSQVKVFVADAGSTDGTPEVALSFRGKLDISVIPGGLPSVGRNAGARLTDSEYILFLDADIELPDRTMLQRGLELMRKRNLLCATTSVNCLDGNIFDHMLYATNNVIQRIASFSMPFGTGMFILFERKAFQRLGGFHEGALFAEDYLLTKQVPIRRFGVIPGHLLTSARRMRTTGRVQMIWLFTKTMFNTWNLPYFLKDHHYWDKEVSQQR